MSAQGRIGQLCSVVRGRNVVIAIATVLLLGVVVRSQPSDAARSAHRPAATDVVYVPDSNTALAQMTLVATPAGALSGRVARITDLAIRISAGTQDISALLALADGPASTPVRPIFTARLLLVANGRLHRNGLAQCSSWATNISTCRLACEGGTFRLQRRHGAADVSELRLVLSGPLGIAACDFANPIETRLATQNVATPQTVLLSRTAD